MKIFYDKISSKWFHPSSQKLFTMGGEKQVISYQQANHSTIFFNLRLKNGHIGPMIGIITAKKFDGSIAGNIPLFTKLQRKLITLNGICFIFTLDGVYEHEIDGYLFMPDKNLWIKVKMPFPDLVYNRIPFRNTEQEKGFSDFIALLMKKNIPFFNPAFIDKLALYEHFQNQPILQAYMPTTEQVQSLQQLSIFLGKYKSVYLKPASSAKGKGIFRLKQREGSEIQMEGLTQSEIFPTLSVFWEKWQSILQKEKYIVQEEIPVVLHNGKRFDFRILAHADSGSYVVTGVGIRQSQKQNLTTHTFNGGSLLPYQEIQSTEHDQFIQEIVKYTGKALSERFGYFGEFSIDAAKSTNGNYYIFEVNSKPMSFDETNIEAQKISKLCRLFLQLTKFESSIT